MLCFLCKPRCTIMRTAARDNFLAEWVCEGQVWQDKLKVVEDNEIPGMDRTWLLRAKWIGCKWKLAKNHKWYDREQLSFYPLLEGIATFSSLKPALSRHCESVCLKFSMIYKEILIIYREIIIRSLVKFNPECKELLIKNRLNKVFFPSPRDTFMSKYH